MDFTDLSRLDGDRLGFVADYDSNGWSTYSGDYFTPGTPEEGFMTRWTVGTTVKGNYLNKGLMIDGGHLASGTAYISPSTIEILSSGSGSTGKQSVLWQGTEENLKLTSLTEFDASNLYFVTTVAVQNLGMDEITDFHYVR